MNDNDIMTVAEINIRVRNITAAVACIEMNMSGLTSKDVSDRLSLNEARRIHDVTLALRKILSV